MSGFAALMALSRTQTEEAQSAVQTALLQRQRNEALKRKQQEERERKERELEAKLRQKHFDDEKKEQERQERKAQERKAAELALQKREEEQRDALRYGPKKAKSIAASEGGTPKWPTSASQSQSREDVRRRRLPKDDDDDSVGGSPGLVLTREEKRERKLQAQLNKTYHMAKRSTQTGGYHKHGKRLPGGALDITTPSQAADPGSGSIKDRISAMSNTLTKLNVVKRDTRTIDEILQDRAKARGDLKVLDGDEAREFSDWFVKSKKKEPIRKIAPSAPTSGANTPVSPPQDSRFAPTPANGAGSTAKKPNTSKLSSLAIPKSSAKSPGPPSANVKSSTSTSRPASSKAIPKTSTTLKAPSSSTSTSTAARAAVSKKRTRSPTLSESPPPSKRRNLSPVPSQNNFSAEIWKLFGKDRDRYVKNDVMSDDEDMEVDARVLEREEKMSARLAKQEEDAALEEERRHEEEKRRRKKEKKATVDRP